MFYTQPLMQGNWNTAKIALLVLAAAFLAWLGASIPMHFRTVSRLILEEAGKNTRTVQSLSDGYVQSGKSGPLRILWESHLARPTELDRTRVVKLIERNPRYLHSGGPSPYYEAFLNSIPPSSLPGDGKGAHVIDLVLPAANGEIALNKLRVSDNSTVRSLLGARSLTEWKRLMPVASPAGRPLDASIITLAMYVDASEVRPAFASRVALLANGAKNGDKADMEALENTLLATLSLGRHLNWTEMGEIMSRVDSPEDLADFTSRAASAPGQFPVLYASTLLVGDYRPIATFLRAHPGDEGLSSLRRALRSGVGALDFLFAGRRTIYRAPALLSLLDKPFAWARPTALTTPLSLRHPRALLAAKIVLLFASGLALALALSNICRTAWSVPCDILSRRKYLPFLAKLFVAGCFTILIWLLIEPNLLQFSTERPARVVFEIGTALSAKSPQTQAMNANSLDQASVLSLIFFFLLQLAIYAFSVMRLSRLRAMNLPAQTKLKLLENDENLFDLGLYVGLAGTIAAFLMLAMNIIQASLVAAYSSALFGILFVALLKVVHIRTFRTSLILQIQSEDNVKKS
jgi:hypothetical protein